MTATNTIRIIKNEGSTTRIISAGPAGPPGAGMNFRGAWNVGTSYAAGDAVTLNGSTYFTATNVTGTSPPNSPWQVIAQAANLSSGSLDDLGNVSAASPLDITLLGYRTGDSTWKAIDLNDAINVKLYGAVGDGSTDDTTAIQNAINAATNGLGPNRHAGVYFPSGIYVCNSTLTVPLSNGVRLYGSGTAVDAVGSGHLNILRGSILKFTGGVGLTLDGCYGFRISNLTIQNADIGVRLQNRNGYGSGVGVFEQITTLHGLGGIGFQVGYVPAGVDHNASNAGDITFIRCITKGSHANPAATFFQSLQDQNLNYEFIGCVANYTDDCFDLVKGGNMIAIDFTTYDCGNVLKVTSGGINVGNALFHGLRIDGSARYTTIFKAAAAATITATFDGITINVGQLNSENYTGQAARFQLKQGSRVDVSNSCCLNWTSLNTSVTGPIASFDASAAGGAICVLYTTFVTPTHADHIGTNTSNRGILRLVDCYAVAGGLEPNWTSDNSHLTPWSNLTSVPSTFTPSAHTHDDRYYTTAQVDTLVGDAVPKTLDLVLGSGLTGSANFGGSDISIDLVFGSTSGTVCQGNDSRLSDARTPVSHNHAASEITSGVLATARLGAGTANSSKVLKGDGAWVTSKSSVCMTFSGQCDAGVFARTRIPYGCTVKRWTVIGTSSGSITIDVRKTTIGSMSFSSIAGSDKPRLSSQAAAESTSLTGWTTSISSNDLLEFYVEAGTLIDVVTVVLELENTDGNGV